MCLCLYILAYVNQEQDVLRLGDKGSSTDFMHPMADKMADFALETQGQKHLHVTEARNTEILISPLSAQSTCFPLCVCV